MPKRKTIKGKRSGGNVGKKASQTAAAKDDVAEMKIDLFSNQELTAGFEAETAGFEAETAGLEAETSGSVVEAAGLEAEVAVDDSEAASEDPEEAGEDPEEAGEDPEPEQSIDENQSFEQDVAKCVLDIESSSELKGNTAMKEEQCNNGLNKDNPGECVEIIASEKSEHDVELQETGPFQEALEIDSNAKESVLAVKETLDSQGDKCPLTELQEEKMLEAVDNAGNVEESSAELGFVDKDFESDQKEMEEIQYIDEEACEDQQLLDIMESLSNPATVLTDNSETLKEDHKENQSEKPELIEDCEISAELMKSSAIECQKNDDIDNSKFEEISEGSIDQDQEELAAETFSDIEIIGDTLIPKKPEKIKNINNKNEQISVRYKEAESLEEVFFATENDDAKITAEDKDNDDISDASLSDHADANMSLEEISDDDLEPSKRKRKPTGMTPVKTEKMDENAKPDTENINKLEEKPEGVKTNQTNTTISKRAATDDIGGAEGSSSKRFKVSSEVKGSEETSESGLFTAGGDLKKEGKKSQAKESEVSHSRNVLKRSSLQSSKNEQQDNRERPLPSRDVAEHRRRFELINSSCQTEPRLLKGKIVQCNINPIKLTIEPGRFEVYSGSGITVTKLLNQFRNQIPSSIPEKIFSEVTSLQSPHKVNTYSFSMGPVTLSDMDCPKFRDVLRCAEEFSLAFDRHCQGILKASVTSHESLASLISQLKLLELGNRYMVMSVVYRHGSVDVWKATIMFMYEQDIQMESQSLVSDGKVRAKLCLKGVPKGVSKDFIHLLFPEAINVGTGPGTFEERIVVLGFSNTKMVEEILSCYDLLVICGSQINISDMNSSGCQQNKVTDVCEESVDLIREGTKLNRAASEQPDICINLEVEKEMCHQQSELEPHADCTAKNESKDLGQSKNSKQDQNRLDVNNSEQETDKLTGLADVLEQEDNVIVTEGKDPLFCETDSCKESTQIIPEINEVGAVCTTDLSQYTEMNTSHITTESPDEQLTSQSKKDKNKLDETEVIILDDDDDAMNSEKADVSNPSASHKSDISNALSMSVKEDMNEQEAITQDKSCLVSEMELVENTQTPAKRDSHLEDTNRDISKSAVSNTTEVSGNDKNFEKKLNVLKKEASKETNDENLEDVSDEEIINQSKHEDHDDVVIVKEDSTQWVAANIDLTNEESDTSGKVVNESRKDLTEEKRQRKINDGNVRTVSGNNGGANMDPKLVMTDGGLEVSLEVIDVNDGGQEVDKVIYARTWRQSRDRSRERNKWDTGNFKTTPYVQMPWRENQWSYAKRPDVYSSQNPYKYYPPKESVPRVRKHYSREESPNYRAPAREETAHRRYSNYAKHRRNPSPSPKRDLNFHGHSSSHVPDQRGNTDNWDKRYDNWRPSTYGDSRKTDSYSRPAAEPSGRPAHVQSRSTTYHSSHAWRESQYDSAKADDRYSHNSRGTHYREHRHDYRKTRSRSYSDMSESSEDHFSPVRKSSYRRESPYKMALHVSRSPISVSSRSHSLSPVSKSPSPSVEYSKTGAGKEELVKTVKHFLELAKGLQQAQKRRPNRSRSSKSPSLRHSKSPLPARRSSPHSSRDQSRKAGRSSRHAELPSPHRMRSRSPLPLWSRNSRSPSYTRTSRYKYDRSPSPSSPGGSYKKHHGDHYNDRKGKSYRRESESPGHEYESKRSQRTGDSSKLYEEHGSRSKSGQTSDPKYRSSGDQSWQQSSSGGYQQPQSSGPSSTSNIYNPAYPPPGMYSGSSMPVYPYSNNQSQYNYSSIPPPYVQSVPPPQVGQSYQSSYSVYQPSQSYTSSGHHNTSLQTSSTGVSSNNTSKSKKSWSMGSSAMAFQRVLGSTKGDKKSKSGVIEKIEDRERLERPKYTKQERVLATVQMEKK